MPIEGKEVTGFLQNKFIDNKNKVIGVVIERPSNGHVTVYFSGEISGDSGNPITISTKWLLENAKIVHQKDSKNDSDS